MTLMLFLVSEGPFNVNALLFGGEDAGFLPEVALRSVVMFVIVLISLKLLGKRGVKQLSIFELVIILTLGSAAGDPMFYKDVGLLPAAGVFVMIISLYRLLIYLAGKSDKLNHLIEGEPVCLVDDGKLCIHNFTKEPIAYDEMFAQMRMNQVSHLGQVRRAYIETSGELSIFYFTDDRVKWGLPIMPELLENCISEISRPGMYSCLLCGNTTEIISVKGNIECTICNKHNWVSSINEKRIA